MYYLLAVCASMCFALQFCTMKLYQKYTVNNLTSALVFSAASAFIGLFVFLCLNGFSLAFTWFTFVLGILLGLVSTLSTIVSIKILAYGKLSVYSLFMMLGGMALPYVFGLIVFSEAFTVLKLVGMVLMIISLALSAKDKTSAKAKAAGIFYLLCLVAFVINGSISVLSALQGRATEVWGLKTTELYDYMIWNKLFTLAFSLLALPLVFLKGAAARKEELGSVKLIFKPKPIIAGLGFTIISTLGFYLQQVCTANLDSSVLFPITTGGTVVLSAVFGLLFYKEKTSLLVWICIALTAVSTVLFALGDVFPIPIFG